MHDARARSLIEATLLHGGEAQVARDNFAALSENRQDELIEFLKSLQVTVTDPRYILANLPLPGVIANRASGDLSKEANLVEALSAANADSE